jgi:hypothetical protein
VIREGDWHALCQVCGMRYYGSELVKRWDGFYVCSKDFEPRHPLDFLNIKAEDVTVPYVIPDSAGAETSTSGWQDTLTTVPSGNDFGNDDIT